MRYIKTFIILIVIVALASCNSNQSYRGDMPKFARWELDSLTEISPKTLVAEGVNGAYLEHKWSLTVIVEGTTTTEYQDGSSVTSPNQCKIDKQQYIDFKDNGFFELSITETACSELKEKVRKMFGAEYTKPGMHHGTYKCYDAVWCGCTCDGGYGVVLYNEKGKELCRFAFVYVECKGEELFSLSKVEMKDPYRDDISSSIGFYLHKQ